MMEDPHLDIRTEEAEEVEVICSSMTEMKISSTSNDDDDDLEVPTFSNNSNNVDPLYFSLKDLANLQIQLSDFE